MHIESNTLVFKDGYYDDDKLQLPEGTQRIRISLDDQWGWKIRCYDENGNKLRSLRFIDKD